MQLTSSTMTLHFGIITVMQMYRLEKALCVDISNSIGKLKVQVLNLKNYQRTRKKSIKITRWKSDQADLESEL